MSDTFSITNQYVISIEDNSLLPVAEKLVWYLKPICQAELPITENNETSPCIRLQYTPLTALPEYSIQTKDNSIYISGSDLAQTVRGVYAFLQKYCGVSCFTSKTISSSGHCEIPSPLQDRYIPYFEYTETDWISPKDTEYSLFRDINGGQYRSIPKELGGTVSYISKFAHTLTTQFCSADTYFKEHPEYFALRHGKRTKKQLCLSHPEVLEIVTTEVLNLLKKKHDPSASLQIVSLSQHDNIAYCRCPECRKLDQKYDSHAGSILTFVNTVAKRVKEDGYHNVAIDTFAYRYSRKPPKNIKAEENVIVRLCSTECCFSHSLDDDHCKTNQLFKKDLLQWESICHRLYIWDYCANFNALPGPFPDFHVLQPNIQFFNKHNVKGIYEEGNYTLSSCDPEFAELRAYLLTNLFHDPYCDLEEAKDSFLTSYYGDSSNAIKEILNSFHKINPVHHVGIFQSMKHSLKLTKQQILHVDRLWNLAKNSASSETLPHILHSELCWKYWKMKTHSSEFSNPFSYQKKKNALLNEFHTAGITQFSESKKLRALFVTLYQDCFFLFNSFFQKILDFLYRI